ncbi:MAG: hypothetical protein FWC43_05345, partial [Planctomycetaceae bacterium]|nr:hypothetical protein [Planctomycetaceae bacterium]
MRRRLVGTLFLLTVFLPCSPVCSQDVVPAPKTAAELRAENLQKRSVPDTPSENSKNAERPKLTPFEIQDQKSPKQKHLLTPDRTVARPLEQARQLVEQNRASDAVALIKTVLEGNDDFFLEPKNAADRATQNTFKRSAEELLLSLPEETRQLYALQNEPLAGRLLKNAVEAGSFDQLEKIVDRYFYTEAGKDAAFLLAMNQYEQGARASALLTFRRLAKRLAQEGALLDAYEPTFSLTYAACAKAIGHETEAKEILDAFLRRNPNPRLKIGGNEFWNPATSEEILVRLESESPDIARWIEHSGW